MHTATNGNLNVATRSGWRFDDSIAMEAEMNRSHLETFIVVPALGALVPAVEHHARATRYGHAVIDGAGGESHAVRMDTPAGSRAALTLSVEFARQQQSGITPSSKLTVALVAHKVLTPRVRGPP